MNVYDYAEAKSISVRRVLDFTLLANPLGPCTKAKHAMRKALKSAHLPPDPQTRYLRGFIARKEHITAENIFFGQGSAQILDLCLAALKPVKVLAPSPVPIWRSRLLEKHGARLISFHPNESRNFSPDAGELLTHLEGADMLLLPNPHPVTGAVFTAKALCEIADALDRTDAMLVIDEALAGFAPIESPVERAVRSDNVLILRTFSFFHALAGMPLGYAIGRSKTLAFVGGALERPPVCAVRAAAALASLRDAGLQKRTAEFLAEEKTYLIAKLSRVDGVRTIDAGPNGLLVAFTGPVADLRTRFLKRNIMVETYEDESGQYIHLPLRQHADNARFARTLRWIMAEEAKA